MYGQCLITPTLLDAYEFAISAPHNWQAKAKAGLLAKIRREAETYPDWVKRGKDFEDTVTRVCKSNPNSVITQGSDHFNRVCNLCQGGTFQEKLCKSEVIDSQKVYLFGFADVTFPERIVDIKTTLGYKGEAKYLKGNQHLIYCYIKRVPKFKYVVAEWLSETDDIVKAVHEIDYEVTDFNKLEKTITDRIVNFFEYLRAKGLWLDYYQTFSKN